MIRLALVFTSLLAAPPSPQEQAAEICLPRAAWCELRWEDEHGFSRNTDFEGSADAPCAPTPPTARWWLFPLYQGDGFTQERFAETLELVRDSAIRGLDLERYGGTCDADLRALAALTELRHLRLSTEYAFFHPGSKLTDDGFLSLVALRQLESLTVNEMDQVDDGAISAVVSKLPRLRHLALENRASIADPLIRALREHPRIDEVRMWGLEAVGSEEVAAFCDATGPIRLELEWMEACDAELLGMLPNAAVLRHLSLACNRWLDDAAAEGFARFEALEVLDVSKTKLGAAGLAHVARLPKLRSLSMRSLGREALPALEALLRNETLQALDLSDCPWLGASEIELLFEADRLRVVELGRCRQLRLSDIQRLRAALPRCDVRNE